MRSEQELRDEQERVTLLLQAAESRIRNFVRVCADDEYELRELVANASVLRGRLREIRWVRG